MILPIGHQQGSVRRWPWVSFAVIALCFVAFLGTDTSSLYAVEPDGYLQDATDYWRERAYLDADPEILSEVAYDVPPNQRSQYIPILVERSHEWAPEDAELWAAEQAELDRLTDLALGRALPGIEDGVAPDNPYQRYGLIPASPSLLTTITHIFMHGGWLHLLGNLLMFFLVGPAVEDRYGRPLFGAFFVTAGIAAGLFYVMMTPGSPIPLVGASGAIAGAMGAFLVLYGATKIKFLYFFMFGFRVFTGTFEAKALLMLPLWFANELFQAWVSDELGLQAGVAYWAHVGGFLFGVGAALTIRQLRIEERFVHSQIESKITLASANPVIEDALAARQSGQLEEAYAMLVAEREKDSDDPDLAIALWDAAVALQRPEDGAEAFASAIRHLAGNGDLTQAALYWAELTNLVPEAAIDAGTSMRILPTVREKESLEKQIELLRSAVSDTAVGCTTGIALRVLEEARDIDPSTALRAALRALESPELHEAKREGLQSQVDAWVADGVEATASAPVAPPPAKPSWEGGEAIAIDDLDVDWDDDLTKDPRQGASSAVPHTRQIALEPGEDLELDGAPGASPLGLDPADEALADPGPPPLRLAPAPDLPQPPPLPEAPLATPPPLPSSTAMSLDSAQQDLDAAASPLRELSKDEAPPPMALGPDGRVAREEEDDELSALELPAGLGATEGPRFASLKVVDAVPRELAGDQLRVKAPGGRKAKVLLGDVSGVAVAAIAGLGPRVVLVIDLLLNWSDFDATTLRSIRLRSDQFDPRALAQGEEDPTTALRCFLGSLLDISGAAALPDFEGARGTPFRRYPDLATYEREVLQVDA